MTQAGDAMMTLKLRSISLSGTTQVAEVTRSSNHGENLLGFANKLRHTNLFNDVTVEAENTLVPTNRMILATYSKYFERFFTSQMTLEQNIVLENVDAASLQQLIEFMYTGNININLDNVCAILSAADLLEIEAAREFCLEFLGRAISAQNCFTIQSISRQFSSESLMSQISVFVSDHFDEIIVEEDFKKLSKSKLEDCLDALSSPDISMESIYAGVTGWVKYDVEARECYLASLLNHVNFHHLSTEHLQQVVLTDRLVRSDVIVINRVSDAFAAHVNRSKKREASTRFVYLGGTETLCDVVMYDPSSKKRTIFPSLANGRDVACAAVVDRTLYFIGGDLNVEGKESPSNFVDVLKLDADELSWEKVAPMNVKRVLSSCAVLNDTIFVVGGHKKHQYLSSGEYYSPVFNSWQMIGNLRQSRHGHALVACKGCLYAIGGNGGKHYLATVERYDPATGEWCSVAQMHSARCWLAAVVLDDVIYAIGGRANRNLTLRSVEKYDVIKDTWSYAGEMNRDRCAFGACVVYGNIWAVGGLGFNGVTERSMESYDPSTNRWTMCGNVHSKLYNHSIASI